MDSFTAEVNFNGQSLGTAGWLGMSMLAGRMASRAAPKLCVLHFPFQPTVHPGLTPDADLSQVTVTFRPPRAWQDTASLKLQVWKSLPLE